MHPDRNFATMAAARLAPAEVFAQLERCKTGTLLAAQAARRVLFCDAAAPDAPGAPGGMEVRRTLRLDSRGRLEPDALRSWLKAHVPDGAEGAPLRVVVNEGSGPYLCRPVQMGADVVVEDVGALLGEGFAGLAFVGARTEATLGRFLGALGLDITALTPGQMPDEGARLLLSAALPQLALISQARCDRALVAAQFLAHHPRVTWVSYPGLPADPANAEARRSLEHGFGPRVAFGVLPDARGFAQGLWEEPMAGLSSSVTCLPGGACVLHAGLEEPLDVVGALEKGIACPEGAPDCA